MVWQLRSAKRSTSSTIWHSSISPATGYSCVSTAIKTFCEITAGRRSRVDEGSISTATRKAKPYLEQLYINSGVYQLRSAKNKHIWRSRTTTAITIPSKSTAGRHGRADQRGMSTAISKAKAYPAQLRINSTVYQPRSAKGVESGATIYQQRGRSTTISTAEAYRAQLYINSHEKLEAKTFWTTQPCRPGR